MAFLAYFGLLLLGTLSTDFRFFDGVRQPHGPPNNRGNFTKIYFVEFEQCGSKFGGWGTFGALLGFTPFRSSHRHLTHASYSSGDPENKCFCLGESAPIWGRYGGLKFGVSAYFGLLLLGTLSTDFRFFDGVRQPHGPPNNRGNFTKIHFVEFEKCGSKVGGWGTFGALLGFTPFWDPHPLSDSCIL